MKRNQSNTKNYKYFTPTPQTAEETKKMYRKLAKQYHPDNGGDTQKMSEVNNEYHELWEKLKNVHVNAKGEQYERETNETPEEFINLINILMGLEGIVIEIIGCFVWVSGDTKPHREALKALKFRWHSKKLCWYLAPEDYKPRSRKDYDMDEIRHMYGTSGEVNSNGMSKISVTS
ncbi:MAG: DnaJ domain-containing protein [Defluviitaleaceae bacterium]|nr:DnaJ domain-containing protein [Defluviitaleaceae bacterium]